MKEIKVRIAPSPTGDPHVGTAYIALFNYVFAKSQNGKFIIRIEDTDRERYSETSEHQILEYLAWLGLNWDEGPDIGGPAAPYRQSERKDIYLNYAKELVEKGAAYYCFCSGERLENLRKEQTAKKLPPGYDGHCRELSKDEVEKRLNQGEKYVIRLKFPRFGNTIVKDRLRGEINFENAKMDDQVIIKSDGFPTYHLAVVVDDHLMGITHVIRAEEWIPSTPKHILLYKAFGWGEPEWIHMPLLRNSDKSKISKRKNDISIANYVKLGYLREALINFLANMGWSFGDDIELFSIEEMIKNFSFDKISLGGPIFDVSKLNWMNRMYIKSYDLAKLTELMRPFLSENAKKFDQIYLTRAIDSVREGANTLSELAKSAEIYFNNLEQILSEATETELEKIKAALNSEVAKNAIEFFKNKIDALDEQIELEVGHKIIENLYELAKSTNESPRHIFMPIRILLTGKIQGPELHKVMEILGKKEILKRLDLIKSKFLVLK